MVCTSIESNNAVEPNRPRDLHSYIEFVQAPPFQKGAALAEVLRTKPNPYCQWRAGMDIKRQPIAKGTAAISFPSSSSKRFTLPPWLLLLVLFSLISAGLGQTTIHLNLTAEFKSCWLNGNTNLGVLQVQALDDADFNPTFVLCGSINNRAVDMHCTTDRWNIEKTDTERVNGQICIVAASDAGQINPGCTANLTWTDKKQDPMNCTHVQFTGASYYNASSVVTMMLNGQPAALKLGNHTFPASSPHLAGTTATRTVAPTTPPQLAPPAPSPLVSAPPAPSPLASAPPAPSVATPQSTFRVHTTNPSPTRAAANFVSESPAASPDAPNPVADTATRDPKSDQSGGVQLDTAIMIIALVVILLAALALLMYRYGLSFCGINTSSSFDKQKRLSREMNFFKGETSSAKSPPPRNSIHYFNNDTSSFKSPPINSVHYFDNDTSSFKSVSPTNDRQYLDNNASRSRSVSLTNGVHYLRNDTSAYKSPVLPPDIHLFNNDANSFKSPSPSHDIHLFKNETATFESPSLTSDVVDLANFWSPYSSTIAPPPVITPAASISSMGRAHMHEMANGRRIYDGLSKSDRDTITEV
ncbi:hypothetical protein SeLEV6574_g03992 [Synchytrium endobioticum]|uniref:Uncharacterized protein n=1 Tax=Synchytrium endobioticum TaxID=286115 RepID=A0A507D1B3_9FUNG|nr:hypothetical protein SeLEV6574_g03992 [Synchytrium endobioticum]